ncbi:MAG: quinoprotein dehydrogenase-associated SoxYZ-like carrier [Hyphomicrobium sp.]
MREATAPAKSAIYAAVVTAFLALSASAASAEDANAAAWASIRKDTYGAREILDAGDKITLDAPIRAEDASVVPLTIKMPAGFAGDVKALTVIVDMNPSPIVGAFTYGPAAGKGERMLSTRVRIDQYSDVRAIAETTDGKLYMVSRFVKASGGCSAPASKDSEEAAKTLGKMQIKTALKRNTDGLAQEAQVMIKHPNNSGLAMDQLTGLYAPAHFVNKIEVKSGSKLVFAMEGGISISENPNFRFSYEGAPADPMEVTAEDSEGGKFAGRSSPSQS